MRKLYRTNELLTHFRCRTCDKWWTISTAPESKKVWFCPWCGKEVKGGKK